MSSIFAPAEAQPSQSPVASEITVPAKFLSAGRAWLFSLLLPGGGQLYCGARTRGVLTITFFVLGILALIFGDEEWRWNGLRIMIFTYAFAGVDAYLTAREHNRGIGVDEPANPRVASVLNLTTNGIGFVYLGQNQAWALVLFFAVLNRFLAQQLPLLQEVFAFSMAFLGYRMARKKRHLAFPPAQLLAPIDSTVPVALPIVFSLLIVAAYAGIVTFAQILAFMEP